MKKTLFVSGLFACILALAAPVQAQEMPAPRRMPRVPVSRQQLEEQQTAPRMIEGAAVIFDGEKMRVADTDLRLFGVVPPQLGASFGPQARATLDALANGQNIDCQIRDRDRDGRLLATCHTMSGADMALELLRRGLAVTARAALTNSDLAPAYLAAEQAAQTQKIGLWSVMSPPPASVASPVTTATVTAPAPQPAPLSAHTEIAPPAPAPVAAAPHTEKTPAADEPTASISDLQAKAAASILTQLAQADESNADAQTDAGFFQRYQILIASILMLITALSIIAALWAQKRRDKRDEAKAVAAALRGELMAARGVCVGRIKSIASEDEDRASTWPRIRSTLYQAYVGRLGMLGAELARQVASIYGQASDYASFYSPTGTAYDSSKKHALETLVRHIDEVLPKLAGVEQSGTAPALYYQRPRSRYDEPSTLLRTAPPPALRASYKTIDSTAERKPAPAPEEHPVSAYEKAAPSRGAMPPAADAHYAHKPAALWEAVRGFIQNHRDAIIETHDEHISEYAEMIEADMERYPYSEQPEEFDITHHKRNG